MNAPQEPPVTLLPTGFIDLLQHEAEAEAQAQGIARIMGVFSQYGYEQVRSPLIEFEASLLAGGRPGALGADLPHCCDAPGGKAAPFAPVLCGELRAGRDAGA
ncbi:MAG: ATP phosphoribosyltransferase regulatory subunit [Acetobacteraceae bacterium]